MTLKLWWLIAGMVALLPSTLDARDPNPSPAPNVIVFLVDDMGVMDTSVPFLTDRTGQPHRYPLNDFYRTPNMERLAERGIRFSQFNAMSVCSPTRISLLTGQNAARHRTTNWINPDQNNGGPQGPPDWDWQGLRDDEVTLPRLLQSAGYRTIHIGKGHFAPREAPGADPRNLGFEINVAGASIGAPATYEGLKNYGNAGGPVRKTAKNAVPHLEKYHGTETFLTEALTLEARHQLDQAIEARQPFFLYLAHYAVHAPFNQDARFAAHYAGSGKDPPAQAFAALIEGMDKSLGDLLQHVSERGVADQTLVLFLGDNGSDAPLGDPHAIASAAPLRGKKGSHYEGGTRVPLIAAWAQPNPDAAMQRRLPIRAGAVQTQPAAVYDLFPTILRVAGVTLPSDHVMDGTDLAPLLQGKPDAGRSATFLMHYPHAPHRSDYFSTLRDGDWKLIYHYFPSPVSGHSHYQLFNLAEDPFEQHDRAQSEPDTLGRLVRQLERVLSSHEARLPVGTDGHTPVKIKLP